MKNLFINSVLTLALLTIAGACNNGSGNQPANTVNNPVQSAPQGAQQQVVNGDDDKVVDAASLPQSAQEYINKYLPGKQIANVTADNDDFNVLLNSGERLEFTTTGEIKEIECAAGVPASVVEPRVIEDVKTSNPQATIVKIEKSGNGGFEVKLNNGLKINYDANFNRLGYDD